MSKQHPVDEVFGMHTPIELDIGKIERYFKDLEYSVRRADKVLKYRGADPAKDALEEISSELSWVAYDVHQLFRFYNDAQNLIDSYRSIAEERMTEDEIYKHRTIMVRNKLEDSK